SSVENAPMGNCRSNEPRSPTCARRLQLSENSAELGEAKMGELGLRTVTKRRVSADRRSPNGHLWWAVRHQTETIGRPAVTKRTFGGGRPCTNEDERPAVAYQTAEKER